MQIVKGKYNNDEILVKNPQLPNTMEVVKCSSCGKPHMNKLGTLYQNNDYKFIVARTATALPICIFIAFLCDECEEKRQQWCEKKTGLKRGSVVGVFNGSRYKEHYIKYFFDEKTVVNKNNYCIYVGVPSEMFNSNNPVVKKVKASLF